MKVIKTINNNAAIGIDGNGMEVVIIGKGVGFQKPPYEMSDMSKVSHTYYDVEPMYLGLLNEIPHDIFDVASRSIDFIRSRKNILLNSNMIFSLADHIYFALERQKKGIHLENPLYYDIKHLYEEEYAMASKILDIIYKYLAIRLPNEEIAGIALYIVNAEGSLKNKFDSYEIIRDIIDIVSRFFDMYIDKDSVNYSRFVSHLQYLIRRKVVGKKISSENIKMFAQFSDEFPKVAECVNLIGDYLKSKINLELNDEEKLYLMLHVNCVCIRNR